MESVSNEEKERLIRSLELAAQELRRSVGGKSGEGAEKKYGIAYKACVRAGIKPALRRKYMTV